MNTPDGAADRAGNLHGLLLRLAAQLPDELLTLARDWLAAGEAATAGPAVAVAALTGRVMMSAPDAQLLARELSSAGAPDIVANDFQIGATPPLMHGFSSLGPDFPSEESLPFSPDLTVSAPGPDLVDQAAIRAMAGSGAHGLWRCWRYPAAEVSWPPPRRVYLVLVAADADPVALTAAVQTALSAAGEKSPQVEAYRHGQELPVYQQTALSFSALIWSDRPAQDIPMARMFDGQTPEGSLSGTERERVLGYLAAGVPLVISNDYAADLAEPARGEVVPMVFRTDGTWIWSDACAYYLAEHSLAPDANLLAHIAAAGHHVPDVDDVLLHRALNRLYRGTSAPVVEAGIP